MARRILIAVDNSDDDEKAMDWMVENLLLSEDEIHIIHVVSREAVAINYSVPPLPGPVEDSEALSARLRSAEEFIRSRFLPKLAGHSSQALVHLIKSEVDNDAIGRVICEKAESLHAAVVVLAKHTRGAIKEFFLGSVCMYCVKHCKRPVLVHHEQQAVQAMLQSNHQSIMHVAVV
eukprot:TRINITY_DN16405_c2_g1_i3.p1 TRINITY_DN16405_c2_g1~~TRINITY_DN16405_c2_g1_i3.p1  ORF type:complete len:176 (-),score=15.88 TRINITY_DN16405_c2_g1_i3:11-538(-)